MTGDDDSQDPPEEESFSVLIATGKLLITSEPRPVDFLSTYLFNNQKNVLNLVGCKDVEIRNISQF